MTSPAAIAAALRDQLGLDVAAIRLTAGGDINDAYCAELGDGDKIFVKSSTKALPGTFSDEAAGLLWLGQPDGGVSTPEVVGVIDEPDQASRLPRLLALRWIHAGRLGPKEEERLGRGLAAIHAAGAPAFGATPLLADDGTPAEHRHGHSPMRFNELELPNEPCATWAEFYAERRIRPLVEACRRRGELTTTDCEVFVAVCERMDVLAGPPEPPARIHGDLWSGNVMADSSGKVYLIDPVAHGGHRELDLALLKVFGGPGERCFAAYREVFPLADGHAKRERLWQLAMILLHVYLFGGGYRGQALAIARAYL